jgi:hypothetical protein
VLRSLEVFATVVAPLLLLLTLVLLIIGLFSRYRKLVIAKAGPAFIAGLFAAFIIPLATEIYWKRQKDFEICVQDRAKRYDLVGSTARTYTTLFKIHTRLFQLSQERTSENRARGGKHSDSLQTPILRSQTLDTLRSDLVKERIQLEGQLGADSALVAQYLPKAALRYYEVAKLYDGRTSGESAFFPNPTEPLVTSVVDLIVVMANEARSYECR